MSFVVCLAPGGGLEPPCPCIAVCLLSLVLGCSCSFPGWEGLAPLCVLCFVAPAPHGGLISVMILSLRPGTRQDPLKNSSGLLAAEPSVQIIAARCSRLSQVAVRAPPFTNNIYKLVSKHSRVALYTCLLYLSSKHPSSVISPVPLQYLQVAGRYGCIPFPPQCGQMIGSFSSMA